MYKKILVPIDGSDTANLALNEAIRLAKHHKARIRPLHVVDKLIFAPGDPCSIRNNDGGFFEGAPTSDLDAGALCELGKPLTMR